MNKCNFFSTDVFGTYNVTLPSSLLVFEDFRSLPDGTGLIKRRSWDEQK